MNKQFKVLASIAAAFTVMYGACNANAAVVTSASYSGSLGGNLVNQTCSHTNTDASGGATATCSLADTVYGTGSGLDLSSSAMPGLLRASLNVHVSSQFNTGYNVTMDANSNDSVSARFSEYMTINSSGRTGQHGTLTAPFMLHGSALTNITGPASGVSVQDTHAEVNYSGNFSLGSAYTAFSGRERDDFNSPGISIVPASVYQLTTPFIFGTPFPVSAYFGITSSAWARRVFTSFNPPTFADSTADAIGDFGNTIYWGGITSVTDNLGNAVTTFTVTSESGFDYTHAAVVPVPAAAWLFGSGLLGLVGVARRKARALIMD